MELDTEREDITPGEGIKYGKRVRDEIEKSDVVQVTTSCIPDEDSSLFLSEGFVEFEVSDADHHDPEDKEGEAFFLRGESDKGRLVELKVDWRSYAEDDGIPDVPRTDVSVTPSDATESKYLMSQGSITDMKVCD